MNEVSTMKEQKSKIVSSLSYEVIRDDPKLLKRFGGLTPFQFEVLLRFLNDVCPMENINYWNFGESIDSEWSSNGPESEFTRREKLFICLVRLKRGFTLKTLAALLPSPDRKIEQTLVRKIFTTYIQLMYKIFRDMQTVMFPERANKSTRERNIFTCRSHRNGKCLSESPYGSQIRDVYLQ